MAVVLVVPAGRSGGARRRRPPGASPIDVETLELEPTVVKTGDLITQTYRVRFPDLISEGREIIILEDRMAPENLPVHPFEAVSLDMRKRQVDDEHVWDFEYRLRLMSPEKAILRRSLGFSFYYLTRDLGEDVEDAEVEQVDAGGGNWFATSRRSQKLPLLDIRDTIELGDVWAPRDLFRALAWGVAPLPLLVWFVFLVRHMRADPKTVSEDRQARGRTSWSGSRRRFRFLPRFGRHDARLLDRVRAFDDLAPRGQRDESLHTTSAQPR